jgi:hypothetical protein
MNDILKAAKELIHFVCFERPQAIPLYLLSVVIPFVVFLCFHAIGCSDSVCIAIWGIGWLISYMMMEKL